MNQNRFTPTQLLHRTWLYGMAKKTHFIEFALSLKVIRFGFVYKLGLINA